MLNTFISAKHKNNIQRYLGKLNYAHPNLDTINYTFYDDLDLMKDYDMYWTFDFCEYKIESFEKIITVINHKEHWDVINATKCRVGSLANNASYDILLIHDHLETSHLFYAIINNCIKLNLTFKTVA